MPFWKRIAGFCKRHVSVRRERRRNYSSGPHGFNAVEKGRRNTKMRVLDSARGDIGIKIQKKWIDMVSKKAEKKIAEKMRKYETTRDGAIDILQIQNDSVEGKFHQGNIHYVLQYDFFDGKFYWRSTRRLSESDEQETKA